jgi:hypothetical protein
MHVLPRELLPPAKSIADPYGSIVAATMVEEGLNEP